MSARPKDARLLPYDDPSILFRVYPLGQCDEDGYPFVWRKISEEVRRLANYECSECGKAYLRPEYRCPLDVHHRFREQGKQDCRRGNLESICRFCHTEFEHSGSIGKRDSYCRYCKGWYTSRAHLRRHQVGKHYDSLQRKLKKVMPLNIFEELTTSAKSNGGVSNE